jgi:hypothetical protein
MQRAAHERGFLSFLDTLIAPYGTRREIHVILDNLSAPKTPEVTAWRVAHRSGGSIEPWSPRT